MKRLQRTGAAGKDIPHQNGAGRWDGRGSGRKVSSRLVPPGLLCCALSTLQPGSCLLSSSPGRPMSVPLNYFKLPKCGLVLFALCAGQTAA